MKTKQSSSKKIRKIVGQVTIGIDIGDQWSHYCTLSDAGEVIEEGRFRTTAAALGKHFADIDSVRIALENGTHSIWINEQLRSYGHEVIVANVRELHAICRNDRKSDRVDAEKLARFARLDPNILRRSLTEALPCRNHLPSSGHATFLFEYEQRWSMPLEDWQSHAVFDYQNAPQEVFTSAA